MIIDKTKPEKKTFKAFDVLEAACGEKFMLLVVDNTKNELMLQSLKTFNRNKNPVKVNLLNKVTEKEIKQMAGNFLEIVAYVGTIKDYEIKEKK